MILLSSTSAYASYGPTIPATPDEQAAFEEIERVYHFRQADARIIMRDFLNDYPASTYRDVVTLMLADSYFYDRQYQKAYQYYSRLRDDAFSGDVRDGFIYRKAFCLVKRGLFEQATAYFRSLSGSEKYGEDAEFFLAYIDYVHGDYDKAYAQFKNMKQRGYPGVEIDYYINQIEYSRGEYSKVAKTSDTLLSRQIPEEMKAETMRVGALSHFKLGNKDKAKQLLKQYVALTGDGAHTDAMYALGTIYYDEGNYDDALKLFTPLTEYADDVAQSSLLYIGQIHLANNEPQKAALAFDRATRESWDKGVAETAAYNLAVTSATGTSLPFANTVEIMENFIETYPSSPYASSLSKYLANAYYNKRDYQAALRQIDKISPQDNDIKETRQKILYQMGLTDLKQGHLSTAIQYLTEASAASAPDKEVAAQASLWLGDAYFAKKDFAQAAKAYQAAINSGKLGENTALANYNAGYAYLRTRDYGKAETAFKNSMNAKGLTPQQTADARLRYADCLYYNRNYTDALTNFRRIKMEGGESMIYASLMEAEILGRQGNPAEKISILEGLVETASGTEWYNTILTNLADTYSERGDDRKASELYSMIIDTNGAASDNSDAYYAIAANAENLYSNGDMEGALQAYRRLAASGIPELQQNAIIGIMKTSSDNVEIAEYAGKVLELPGLSAELRNEAQLRGAKAGVELGGNNKEAAVASLLELAKSSDRYWGAMAAVAAGEQLLKEGNADQAEEILLHLIDNGSDDNYWLARGYIALSDVYVAKDDEYLAKLYLETLRDNYPGSEKDIRDMISSRLKNLNK